MRTVLFAWQCGGGMGHILQMLPLAAGLVSRGCRVFVALRDLPSAAKAFAQAGVRFLQAPFKHLGRVAFPRTLAFVHVMGNVGFGFDYELFALASAWRNLYRLVRPDLVIFDHAPVALLASRGLPVRRVLIGSGFCCPPDSSPLPMIRPGALDGEQMNQIAADEGRILRRVNWLLDNWKAPPLQGLGELFGNVDDVFLVTFPELDHYGARDNARYWGPINGSGGAEPKWPEGEGKRVFAYLKPCPMLPELLGVLRDRSIPTLVYPDRIGRRMQREYECSTLRFQSHRPDPKCIAAECDLAILNASHGTTCDMLLGGKPILTIPLHPEQELMAERIREMGVGEVLNCRTSTRADIDSALDRLLNETCYIEAARTFVQTHADFDAEHAREEMLDLACELLEARDLATSCGI